MLLRSAKQSTQQGFTIVELLIVMVVAGILSTTMYGFYGSSFSSYFTLQQEGTNFTELATQTNRIGNVVRGLYDVVSATNSDLVIYAYFSPTDSYTSLVHYYKNAGGTALYADVTHMTANPPIGTTIASTFTTYNIITNYKTISGVNLFDYLDASGNVLSTPITDLHTIKGIRVSLAVPGAASSASQRMSLDVSLRNRKTNL